MGQELPSDFKEFLNLLRSRGVRYLLIGGYSVGYHGYPRATGDIDIVSFEECYARRADATLDGAEVPIIGLADLKANKQASGRYKDLMDLDHLS